MNRKTSSPTAGRFAAWAKCAAALAAGVGTAIAADVPWVFSGDTTRAPAGTASASSPISQFVSWTHDSSVDDAEPAHVSTYPPRTVIIVR